jgi:coproporphyrinogen III oxidase-like Fe-S oxidoreductase
VNNKKKGTKANKEDNKGEKGNTSNKEIRKIMALLRFFVTKAGYQNLGVSGRTRQECNKTLENY